MATLFRAMTSPARMQHGFTEASGGKHQNIFQIVLDGTQWTVPVQPKSDGKAKPYQLKEIRNAFIRHNL